MPRSVMAQLTSPATQGDSLSHLYHLACKIEDTLQHSADEEVRGDALELRELLEGRLRHYDQVLQQKGMSRPYPEPKWRS